MPRRDAPMFAVAPALYSAVHPTAEDRRDAALYRRLYQRLRELILCGRLAPGARLPASRALAVELGCSRTSVIAAFDQLLAEGYIEGRAGSGTYVTRVLPTLAPLTPVLAKRAARREPARRFQLSRRGAALADLAPAARSMASAFVPGVPELRAFPFDIWARLLRRTWRRPTPALPRHSDAAGQRPLREAIAGYLHTVRAVRCDWRQVLITSGAQQAIDLVARLLLDPNDAVWIEEPGYPGVRGPLLAAGARLVPVPVDDEGISVAAGRRQAPAARLAVVAPSHQYPLGVTMSLGRRLELLDWARAADAWILEDDYDSEFRYGGRPLAALQGLDADEAGGGRVLYVGSFSKVLFPSLRIGYLVVPPDLVETMTRARAALDDHPSAVAQPALAAFIDEGHFAAHIRRMRALYASRQTALLAAARRHLDGILQVSADQAGLHLVGTLDPGLGARMNDRAVAARAHAVGVITPPLSTYYVGTPTAQGVLLGYAAVAEAEIDSAAAALGVALTARR